MPWKVELNTKMGYIESVYSGTVTKQDVMDATAEALSLTREDQPNLFLTELRDADLQLSTFELHEIPAEWKAAGANMANKLALVRPEEKKLREDIRFLENVSYNRGWQVQAFSSRQLAIEWLTSSNPSGKQS